MINLNIIICILKGDDDINNVVKKKLKSTPLQLQYTNCPYEPHERIMVIATYLMD